MMLARIGAISYVLWGVLHLKAAYDGFELAATQDPGFVQGKLSQGAWDLAFFSIAAILIAILLNWRNDSRGYWLNLVMVSAADLGFVIFVLLPGHIPLFPGLLGPALWLSGALFSTLAILSRREG
ncbi:MAG: hypothetical protein ABJL17_05180 [Parvibaculum sp.]|uniref:hypothetical protein n=1 Tax=Parvibaculum sp. TaxID=2024848 RepID=UPI003263D801